MIATSRYLCITVFLLSCLTTLAQGGLTADDVSCKPPLKRQLFHDYVDREQTGLLATRFELQNEEIGYFVKYALERTVDAIQCSIETDSLIAEQPKVGYIKGLERLLRHISGELRAERMKISNLPRALHTFDSAMNLDKNKNSIAWLIAEQPYDVANAVMSSGAFDDNNGARRARESVLLKYCAIYPDRILLTLKDNPNVPFLDSLVKAAAYRSPRQLYDYAAANNRLAYKIQEMKDPLVRTVARMARSSSGQLYLPFLDNMLRDRISFEEIDAVKNDNEKYYKLLVKTHLEYIDRAQSGDTVMEAQALNLMMEKKAREFVNVINGLHDLDDAQRFRIIQPLGAEELYYLIVSSDGEIYTSSYTNGVYPLMMSRIGMRGDSLLMNVRFDRYRKFLKMAAGYNTLSHFLNSFPDQQDSKTLMRAFVSNLEKSGGLEDGVDVADSYASISETIKPLAEEILANVQWNLERNRAQNNRQGIIIYDLLHKLFLSADSNSKIDLSSEFGIPPVYSVDFNSLDNEKGEVIMQVFFYGDKDGQNIFQGFLRQFDNSNWKLSTSDKWVSISSAKGKPVLIFANKPLPEETGQDADAQRALQAYLNEKGLHPTVVIHRGHSYYAPYTIEKIQPSARVVFMGSCGGYHLINDILTQAPDAHIIASKQIGKTAINQPFFNLLMEKLRNGNSIDWIPFWQELDRVVRVDGFEDYIPPHKNLGAIFIKAYKQKMGTINQ